MFLYHPILLGNEWHETCILVIAALCLTLFVITSMNGEKESLFLTAMVTYGFHEVFRVMYVVKA